MALGLSLVMLAQSFEHAIARDCNHRRKNSFKLWYGTARQDICICMSRLYRHLRCILQLILEWEGNAKRW
jgi:hypothetical protein